MYKRLPLISAMALLFAGMTVSCQKAEVEDDPCAELIGDYSPVSLFVKLVDKETGENIIFANGLIRDDIEVTVGQTEEGFESWDIYKAENPSPLDGTLQFVVTSHISEKEGDYPYKIQLVDFGTVTLFYTVTKKENSSNSPCSSPYYYAITDPRIDDHPFELFEYEGVPIPNILVVAL